MTLLKNTFHNRKFKRFWISSSDLARTSDNRWWRCCRRCEGGHGRWRRWWSREKRQVCFPDGEGIPPSAVREKRSPPLTWNRKIVNLETIYYNKTRRARLTMFNGLKRIKRNKLKNPTDNIRILIGVQNGRYEVLRVHFFHNCLMECNACLVWKKQLKIQTISIRRNVISYQLILSVFLSATPWDEILTSPTKLGQLSRTVVRQWTS